MPVNTTSYIPETETSGSSVNGTGGPIIARAPNITSRALIDPQTPVSAYTKEAIGGTMKLVFSDEFNEDGRTFYPGELSCSTFIRMAFADLDNFA
jgi:beta-glucanase (GH16 family)